MREITTLPDISEFARLNHETLEATPNIPPEAAVSLGATALSAEVKTPGQEFTPNRITSIDIGSAVINAGTEEAPQLQEVIYKKISGPDTITTEMNKS